jgi:hypothetical protein
MKSYLEKPEQVTSDTNLGLFQARWRYPSKRQIRTVFFSLIGVLAVSGLMSSLVYAQSPLSPVPCPQAEKTCVSLCPLAKEENPHPVNIDYDVEGDALLIFIDGIGLDSVKHFIFDGQVIDDFLDEGREGGAVTIEEQQDSFTISVSLLPEQNIVGGVFGIVMSNGTTVSSEISSELLNQNATQPEESRGIRRARSCKARYTLVSYNRSTNWINLGDVSGWSKKGKCENKARAYSLRYSHFGITKQQYCNTYKGGNAKIYYDTNVSGKIYSRDGYVYSRLGVRCKCSGWKPY